MTDILRIKPVPITHSLLVGHSALFFGEDDDSDVESIAQAKRSWFPFFSFEGSFFHKEKFNTLVSFNCACNKSLSNAEKKILFMLNPPHPPPSLTVRYKVKCS